MIISSSNKGDISMNYTQHPYMEAEKRHLNRRADSALDFLAAIAIGVGFALLITAWWTS
jgi:hypothetical protein